MSNHEHTRNFCSDENNELLRTLQYYENNELLRTRVVLVEDLYTHTSVHHGTLRIHKIRLGPSWMDSISLFLEKDVLPEEKSEANKVRRKATQFWLSENRKLYKCSFSGPYLLCVHPKASESLLEELHEGVYGSHTGGRSLSHRTLTQGY